MFHYVRGSLAITCLSVGAVFAQTDLFDLPERKEGDVTIVTSDRLIYDGQGQYAVFEKNVVVTDSQVQMTADKLTLRFDEKGQATTIQATGNVNIVQADKKAVSGLATYDIASGKFVLADNPQVQRGRDVLKGDRITFWRNKNKLVCEPRAQLIIYPQGGSKLGGL